MISHFIFEFDFGVKSEFRRFKNALFAADSVDRQFPATLNKNLIRFSKLA